MKVSLATQTLSASVATAIGVLMSLKHLPLQASETRRVVSMFDNLFDVFNPGTAATTKMFNKPFQGSDYQVEFLNTVLDYLENVKIIDKNGSKNCSDDFDKALTMFEDFSKIDSFKPDVQHPTQTAADGIPRIVTDYRCHDIEANSLRKNLSG
ncbi:hypothetical protein ILUMI_12533 [Ignelater luminosus]|uniref:Transposable element P transposase-like GTP-binding insertion domain-containing protein n=1 Tax=Ignelater luminosus TaxID=2038154 RepID=A0A8K0G6P1_IGNLU|nr:hypothetical protein ILUMI_12533 [Ignelater luminosus]